MTRDDKNKDMAGKVRCFCGEEIPISKQYLADFCEVECPRCCATVDISHLNDN